MPAINLGLSVKGLWVSLSFGTAFCVGGILVGQGDMLMSEEALSMCDSASALGQL